MSTTYGVFPIPPPFSPSQLAAYKALRLTSLQVDPHAFSSRYAQEAAFSEDVWRERLDSPLGQTYVAARSGDGLHEAGETGETSEWIGSATIAGPSRTTPFLGAIREAGVGANWEAYGLFAMWVQPAHRGKGIATQLVKACLEWARANVDANFSSKHSGSLEKVAILLVYDNNVNARALYSRIGFTDLEGVLPGEGQRWMWARL